jgi:uncharacterized membrane protein YheB (UPF0754 family)
MLEGRPLYIFILIPLVSALIGYFTNWVAIRMLFRPHQKKRLFGIRLPFTPGLIPRKRAELAQSIGLAVGEHLVTEEAVAERFADREVKAKLDEVIHGYIREMLSRPLADLNSLIPDGFREEWTGFIAGLKERIEGWLSELLKGEELEDLLREQVRGRVEGALARPFGELLPDEILQGLTAQLGGLFQRLVEDERFEQQVRGFLDGRIDSFIQDDRPVSDYIPQGLRQAVYAKLEEFLPGILDRLIAVLEDQRVQKRIKIHLYELVDRLVQDQFRQDSLWDQMKFGLIETFVISPEEVKLRIDRGVDELAPRVAELVKSPDVRHRIYRSLTGSFDSLLGRRLAEFQIDQGTMEGVKEGLVKALVSLARRPELRARLLQTAEKGMERLRDCSVKELLPALAGEKGELLSERLIEHVSEILRGGAAKQALSGFICGKLDQLLQRPIGRLDHYVSEEIIGQGERAISDHLIGLLQRETPKVVAAIDIKCLVKEKVDQFSTQEVERLIVGVTGDQLKAITWFGAVLGFLIGIVQLGIIFFGS